jgi:hypothetical protein
MNSGAVDAPLKHRPKTFKAVHGETVRTDIFVELVAQLFVVIAAALKVFTGTAFRACGRTPKLANLEVSRRR